MLPLLCWLLSLITEPDPDQQIQLQSTHEPVLATVKFGSCLKIFTDVGGFPGPSLSKPAMKPQTKWMLWTKAAGFTIGESNCDP